VIANLRQKRPANNLVRDSYVEIEVALDACNRLVAYAPRHRAEWLAQITEVGVVRRAEFYYQQLDAMRSLRHHVRRDLLTETKKH
jgi:hypothetical protein